MIFWGIWMGRWVEEKLSQSNSEFQHRVSLSCVAEKGVRGAKKGTHLILLDIPN
jgi:hypothetical protein